jgi:alpha-1,6-mannosyltransferase
VSLRVAAGLEPTAQGRGVGRAAWSQFAEARAWQTNVVLLMIGAAMFLLARQLVSEYDHYTIGFSGVSGWGAVLYGVACWLVLTQPVDRWTLRIVLTVAVVCRLATLFPDPFLSSDVYRYVWDGVVQHAHISPYRYAPGDAALAFLRAPNQDVFDNINRRDYAHTIYPPLAQMIFYLVTWVSPTVTAMKTAMVLFEGVTVAALLALLRELGRRPARVLLYAWCPLLVWEVAGSGHLDSAAMAFIALALLARFRRQAWLTGVWLGIAVTIKFYPLVLLPALWWRSGTGADGGAANGAAWKMPVALAGVIAFGYACYASVGMRVFGFFGGYVQEEGLESGARYFLVDLARRAPGMRELPVWVFYGFCAAVFGGLAFWARRAARRPGSARDGFLAPAFGLGVALMLLFSPHYAWYVIWLIPFFAIQPNLPVWVYLMGFFYGYTTALADPGPRMFLLNEYLYGATALAFLVWLGMRRWPVLGTAVSEG